MGGLQVGHGPDLGTQSGSARVVLDPHDRRRLRDLSAVCLPGHSIGADGRPNECPEATGLLQVRYQYHLSAFEDNNATRSTAYNADYAWSIWRRCFEGEYTWLNDVEHGEGATYTAGDGLGCMGVWFSGRWYTDDAIGYMERLPTAGSGIPMPAQTSPATVH